jgi:hypothetical protein
MFITPNLETILPLLEKLNSTSEPAWGSLSAQGMIEHLTDTIALANGTSSFTKLLIPADKVESMQRFLLSDKEMMRNVEVPFAPKERVLRNDELELAVDEFVDAWIQFEEHFEQHPGRTENHPFYGQLNYDQWIALHKKHITHHFKQFGLI